MYMDFWPKLFTILTLGTIQTVEQAMMTGSSCRWWSRRIGRVRYYVCSICFLFFDPIWRKKSNIEEKNHEKCTKCKASKHYVRHCKIKTEKIEKAFLLGLVAVKSSRPRRKYIPVVVTISNNLDNSSQRYDCLVSCFV